MMNETVLVTGANGFLAMRLIKQLLTNGYHVRATLRSLTKKETVLAAFKANNVTNINQLEFVQADLTKDDGWHAAMQGVTYVMSVAAPVFVNGAMASEKVAQTAVDGTLRILKAAQASEVKRVVMTANLGAVGFSNKDPKHITTESDWTNSNEPGLSIYEKSKLIAEKSAWDYLKQTDSQLEFVTVNAGAMLGPSLDNHVSGSFGIIKNFFDGGLKAIPKIDVNIVDVRDVVDIEIRAMETSQAAGKRFLAVEDNPISMPQLVSVIKENRPQLAPKLPTKTVPSWLIRLGAPFNKQAQEGRLLLDINHHVSNHRAKEILGWQPISRNEDAILTAVDSMLTAGLIK